MSETEYHVGKLYQIFVPREPFEKQVEYLQEQKGIVFEDLEVEEKYFHQSTPLVHYHEPSGTWWSVEDEHFDPEIMMKTKVNNDNSIEYMFAFYNGGASFDEMIDEVLEKTVDYE